MGNSSFSPGNNRRSLRRHECEDWASVYGWSLAITPSFSLQPWVVVSGLPAPNDEPFLPPSRFANARSCVASTDYRSTCKHPCRGTWIRRQQLPRIPPSAMHSPEPSLSGLVVLLQRLVEEVCARATALWPMESGLCGQISPECFVPQGWIGAKYQTLVCPLSPSRLA
jgi:hypothetical protein